MIQSAGGALKVIIMQASILNCIASEEVHHLQKHSVHQPALLGLAWCCESLAGKLANRQVRTIII
jgi:hypothetical protein